jgi:hypothetical protein
MAVACLQDRQNGASAQDDHAVLDGDGVAAGVLRERVRPRVGRHRDPGEPAAVDAIGRRRGQRGAGVRNRGGWSPPTAISATS